MPWVHILGGQDDDDTTCGSPCIRVAKSVLASSMMDRACLLLLALRLRVYVSCEQIVCVPYHCLVTVGTFDQSS